MPVGDPTRIRSPGESRDRGVGGCERRRGGGAAGASWCAGHSSRRGACEVQRRVRGGGRRVPVGGDAGRASRQRTTAAQQPASQLATHTHNSSKKRFGGANGRAAKAAGFMRRAALQVDEGACDCEGCVQAGGKVKNPIRGKGRMLVGALSAAAAGTTEHLPLF